MALQTGSTGRRSHAVQGDGCTQPNSHLQPSKRARCVIGPPLRGHPCILVVRRSACCDVENTQGCAADDVAGLVMAGPALGERGLSTELLSSGNTARVSLLMQMTRTLSLRLLPAMTLRRLPSSACRRERSPVMPCAGVRVTGAAAAMAAAAPAPLQATRGVGQAVPQARQPPAQALLEVHPHGPAPRLSPSTQWRLHAQKSRRWDAVSKQQAGQRC